MIDRNKIFNILHLNSGLSILYLAEFRRLAELYQWLCHLAGPMMLMN